MALLLLCVAGFSQEERAERPDARIVPGKIDESALDSLSKKLKGVSYAQGLGHYVYLENEKAKLALVDMMHNVSFEEFFIKYTRAHVEMNISVARLSYKDKNGNGITRFLGEGKEWGGSLKMNTGALVGPPQLKSRWIYRYNQSTSLTKASIEAFYLPDDFTPLQVPAEYTALINQAQGVVDSSMQYYQAQLKMLNDQLNEAKELGENSVLSAQKMTKKLLARRRRAEIWQNVMQVVPVDLLLYNILTK